MWKWILAVVDFIRALLLQKAESAKKQEEENKELETQRGQIEAKVVEKYDQEERDIPSGGSDLVDYWSKRGVHTSPPDSTPSIRKGRTNSK